MSGVLRRAPTRGIGRRAFLRGAGGALLGLPFWQGVLARQSRAQLGQASRFIVFYFPDGVAGPSQNGDPSLWHPSGPERGFTLPRLLEPLAARRDDCLFFDGLSMGGTDSGSHPGGAKKLLTGVDGGNGESVDQFLARTVGASMPHRHLYLGAMANHNNASGDKHISYPSAGQTVAPEDDPRRAFERLFGAAAPGGTGTGGTGGGTGPSPADRSKSVLDSALEELELLRSRLGETERRKLALHLDALREVEQRIGRMQTPPSTPPPDDCRTPRAPSTTGELYDPARFPEILRAQIDVMVQAMACGLTKVGVIQGSHHTSELIMSRFPGSEMHDPGFDMRSHQASHYGAAHDEGRREFRDFVLQRRWWVTQFAYLLEQLRARPEGDSNMLAHSVVLLCSEVSDGNTHSHDRMPMVLAGQAGGRISTGRFIGYQYERHGNLLSAITHAMGQPTQGWGQDSSGPAGGVLS